MSEKYDFLPEGQELTPDFIGNLEPLQQAVADQINRRTEFLVLSTDYGLN
jgi:peptidoglycan-associated lipoprotein